MSSLSNIMSTGTSALLTTQSQIAVTSSNIGNADDTSYTRKTASTSTLVLAGQGVGVTSTTVTSSINLALERQIMGATSDAAHDAAISDTLESLVATLGSVDTETGLQATATDILNALSEAVASGGDSTSNQSVVDALDAWADELNQTSAAIQQARTDVDSQIAEVVDDINASLERLEKINSEIASASARGLSTADLQDQQRAELETLSGYLDISYYYQDNGEVRIFSAGGQTLLTSVAQELSYDSFGRMSADAVYDPANGGGIAGIEISGQDVTATLSGGTLGALLELRDETLPALQAELDDLAATVAEAVNAVSNASTAVPAPASLTSRDGMATGDAITGTGTMTLVELSDDGTILSLQDFDLSSFTTTQELLDAIAASGDYTVTTDADGAITITSIDGNGIAIGGDGSIDDTGASQFFGFNDLLRGDDASSLRISETLSASTLPLTSLTSTVVGEQALASGDTAALQSLASVLENPIAFSEAGSQKADSQTLVARIASIIDGVSDAASDAASDASLSESVRSNLSTSFSNSYGVNVDEELAILTTLQQSYDTAAQILSVAQEMFETLLDTVE